MERTHLAIILVITALLLTQPAVGVVQTLMVMVGLAAGLHWWSTVGRREVRSPVPSGARAMAIAAGTTLACLGIWAVVYDRYNWPMGVEGIWLMAGVPAALAMGLLGPGRLPGGTWQAVVLGLATTAIWVPIGAAADLDDVLRFHPYAVAALGLGSLALFALDNRGRGRSAWHRLAVLLFVQSISIYWYWFQAGPGRAGTLGYHITNPDQESPDGRLRIVTSAGTHGSTAVDLVDPHHPGAIVRLAALYPPYSGLSTRWVEDGRVRVTWFVPRINVSGGCTMYPVSIFDQDQTETAEVRPCWESSEPLLCLQPTHPEGAPCDRSADCTSQLCRGGVCDRARLGETCVNNATCVEGTCLRRVCVDPDEQSCDDDRDCPEESYCYRLDDEPVGRCYQGVPGDPCSQHSEQCAFGASCQVRGPENLGTCVAGPLYGVVF